MSTTTNLPAVVEPKEVIQLRGYLQQQMGRIARNIVGGLDPAEIVNVTCELARGDSKLRRCEPETVLVSLLQACQLGLTLQKNLGHAYIIPRKNGFLSKQAGRDVIEATFLIGEKGLKHMIRQGNPNVHTIETFIVYRQEVESGNFRMTAGTDSRIEHNPSLERLPLEDYVGVYSVISFKDASKSDFEWMPRGDVERARDVSQAKDDGPWKVWPEEMIRKTVVRRHAKRMQLKPEVAARLRDNEAIELHYNEETGSHEAERPAMPQRRSEQLAAASAPAHPLTGTQDAKPAAAKTPECPKCKGATRVVPAKQGKYSAFYACARGKEACNGTVNAAEWDKAQQAKPAEAPAKQEAAAEPGDDVPITYTAETFLAAFDAFRKQNETVTLAVMKEQGYPTVDELPTGNYGRLSLLEAIEAAISQ